MRTLLLSFFCLLTLLASANAQTDPGLDSNVITFGPDYLLAEVNVGMTPTEATTIVKGKGWVPTRVRKNTLRFRQSEGRGATATLIIGFVRNKANSATMTITIPKAQIGEMSSALFTIRTAMAKRADDVDRKGTRTIFLNQTTDGRTIRTTWNDVSPTKITIEAVVQ